MRTGQRSFRVAFEVVGLRCKYYRATHAREEDKIAHTSAFSSTGECNPASAQTASKALRVSRIDCLDVCGSFSLHM